MREIRLPIMRTYGVYTLYARTGKAHQISILAESARAAEGGAAGRARRVCDDGAELGWERLFDGKCVGEVHAQVTVALCEHLMRSEVRGLASRAVEACRGVGDGMTG